MAKQGKPLPVRRQRERPREDDSILLRSAESVGRMIGTLQRELDGTQERLVEAMKGAAIVEPNGNHGSAEKRKRAKAKTAARSRKSR